MTPLEAAQATIAADRAHADPAIWITRVADDALLEQARTIEASPRGPLWGVTVAVKDNIDVAGLPTTAACPGFAYTPERDSFAVARLRAAGALIVGKTNLDQFATGLVGVRSPYGVPRNVFDSTRVPGGSSSGSAVAVAAGIVQASLGTDTAGSGRVPAMFGNIVGLKPTIGSVSATGVVPACRSVDTVSVFAGNVDLAFAMQRTIAAYDAADPYSRPAPFAHLRRAATSPAVRLAAIAPSACDPGVARVYAETAARLGATMVDIAPLLAAARLLYDGPWVAERTSALRHLVDLGVLHPVTRAIIEGGLTRLTVDAFDAFHQLAQARRFAADLFGRFDALLLPTAPSTPTLAELEADPIGPNSRLGTYTNFVNLCDLAAIAVPAGFDGAMPVGVTVVGPAWSEGRLAPVAASVQGEPGVADPVGARRDGAVLRRWPHVGVAAQRAGDRTGRAVRAGGADGCGVSAVRAGQPAGDGAGQQAPHPGPLPEGEGEGGLAAPSPSGRGPG